MSYASQMGICFSGFEWMQLDGKCFDIIKPIVLQPVYLFYSRFH